MSRGGSLVILRSPTRRAPRQSRQPRAAAISSSFGGYASYASFPGHGGLSTLVIPNGTCCDTFLDGYTNEQVSVYDADNNQYIGSTIYNGPVGETIVTVAGLNFCAYNG